MNDSPEDYSESNRITMLAENVILIRLIWDYSREDRHPFSVQIIWSSKYNWSGLMERLRDDTYDLYFKHEAIMLNVHMRDQVSDDMMITSEADEVFEADQVMNCLPTVIISEDNGDPLVCVICQESICIGDSAKQLPCYHLYHSHCILEWFEVKISCPICRDESTVRLLRLLNSMNMTGKTFSQIFFKTWIQHA